MSNLSFPDLLKQGQIADAIEDRINQLEAIAHDYRLDIEAAKLLSGTLTVAGMMLGSIPIVAVLGGLGLVGYGWMVVQDYQRTKKFCPVPCLRKGVLELFSETANYSDTRKLAAADPVDDVGNCLTPGERNEYELLTLAGDRLVEFLRQIPPESRAHAYRYALRKVALSHALPTVEEAIAVADGVSPASLPSDSKVADASPDNVSEPNPAQLEINTKLNVIEVSAGEVTEPSDRPPVPVSTTGAPDLSSGSLEDRINCLMDALERDGFPIVRLIDEPFLWSYGESQSGKTTIINLVNACRLGLGFKVSYASTDNDFPPLKWDKLAIGEQKYRDYLKTVVELASDAKKGELEGNSFTLDEIFQVAQILELDLNPLMTAAIAKANKSRGCYSFITQNDTLTGLKLEGVKDALETMRVFITAHAVRPQKRGRPRPSGSYTVQFPKRQPETWTLPAWILTDTNSYGEPDPVQWVLNRIPELRGKDPNVRARLEKIFLQDSSFTSETHFNLPKPPETGISDPISDQPETKGKFRNESQDGHFNVSNDAETVSKHFTPQKLTRDQAIAFIQSMKQTGNSQTKIVEALWGVKPGGSKAYQDAIAEYKELTGE